MNRGIQREKSGSNVDKQKHSHIENDILKGIKLLSTSSDEYIRHTITRLFTSQSDWYMQLL